MATVELKNISKTYEGGVKAVDSANLTINDKEFVVLVGPSGCGKTTTLRMVAGLEEITSGELYIDGKMMNDVAPKDRDIAMVFQNYALYPHMTVYDNMAFGLRLRKVPKQDIDRRVREGAGMLGIEHLHLFPDCFDVVFLLGIIYHRPSPLDALREVLAALRPGGTLLLESQAIPGDQPLALFPATTYAKVPGTWFIPTPACLENWLKRSGFQDRKMFCLHPMSSAEQRRTEWMIFESYEDFIDKEDALLTIEGYPAPWRVLSPQPFLPRRRQARPHQAALSGARS